MVFTNSEWRKNKNDHEVFLDIVKTRTLLSGGAQLRDYQ